MSKKNKNLAYDNADGQSSQYSMNANQRSGEKTPKSKVSYLRGIRNLPKYFASYFTKTLPRYRKKHGLLKTIGKVTFDFTKGALKTGLLVGACVPGPIGSVCGTINGIRMGLEASKGKGGWTRFTSALLTGALGGAAGGMGLGIAVVAPYEANRLLRKSSRQYNAEQYRSSKLQPRTTVNHMQQPNSAQQQMGYGQQPQNQQNKAPQQPHKPNIGSQQQQQQYGSPSGQTYAPPSQPQPNYGPQNNRPPAQPMPQQNVGQYQQQNIGQPQHSINQQSRHAAPPPLDSMTQQNAGRTQAQQQNMNNAQGRANQNASMPPPMSNDQVPTNGKAQAQAQTHAKANPSPSTSTQNSTSTTTQQPSISTEEFIRIKNQAAHKIAEEHGTKAQVFTAQGENNAPISPVKAGIETPPAPPLPAKSAASTPTAPVTPTPAAVTESPATPPPASKAAEGTAQAKAEKQSETRATGKKTVKEMAAEFDAKAKPYQPNTTAQARTNPARKVPGPDKFGSLAQNASSTTINMSPRPTPTRAIPQNKSVARKS
ncbi:MAG: hypothetical protein K0R02_1186 [Rickettsiaceae bacterium]|jgi:hypothetical protein|nr:hypothetical protein [Rickettsiaceae bacterium]